MRAACCEATVLRNEVIAPDIRLLTVVWPDRDHAPHAGQFFTLRSWGADEAPFLSRPISVHRWNPDSSTIEFLYQVVGEGTEKLAQLKQQDTFQLTGPMGNGFDVPDILSKYKRSPWWAAASAPRPCSSLPASWPLPGQSRMCSLASATPPTAWRSTAASQTL